MHGALIFRNFLLILMFLDGLDCASSLKGPIENIIIRVGEIIRGGEITEIVSEVY